MSIPGEKQKVGKRNTYNMMIAALAGQVGCLTLVIVLAAVLGGLALDARLGTRPWFTIGLVVASVPVSLILMFFIARKTVAKIRERNADDPNEEAGIGKDS